MLGRMLPAAQPTARARVDGLGPRAWAMAAVAAVSTFDTTWLFTVGPIIAAAVYLTGAPLRLRLTAPVCVSIAFLLWVTASALWSNNEDAVIWYAKLWATLLIVFIAMIDFIRTTAQLRMMAVAYLLGAFSSVIRMAAQNPAILTGGQRVTLDDLNANYLAYAFATGFALVVLLWVTKRRTLRIRIGLAATVVALAAGIYFTGTRGALLSLALLGVWLLACKVAPRPPLRTLMVALTVVTVAIVSGLADQASLLFESGSRATGDWSGRLPLWASARDVWAEHPMIGVGGGQFAAVSGSAIEAHSAILAIGTGLGAVGLLIFLTIFWSALRPAVEKYALVVGAFIVTAAPSYLSGVWETSPAGWVALAIFSRIVVHQPASGPEALMRTRSRGMVPHPPRLSRV